MKNRSLTSRPQTGHFTFVQRTLFRPLPLLCVGWVALAASALAATTNFIENFNDETSTANDGWRGVGNATGRQNFGWRDTDLTAGGSGAGEAGGTFNRTNHIAFYGDTQLGGTFTLADTLHADGELALSNQFWNGDMLIGFFNTNSGGATASANLLGLNISEPATANGGYRMHATVKPATGAQSYSGIINGTTGVTPQVGNFRFSIDYNPAGNGSVTARITNSAGALIGAQTYNLTAAQRAAGATFNAFGFLVGGQSATTNTLDVYMDAANYTTILPSITTQPRSQAIAIGTDTTLSVVVTGGKPPIGYQWRTNGVDIPGATASTYTIVNAQAANAGNYTVVVTNPWVELTSSVAVITLAPAAFTMPPRPIAIPCGGAGTLNVAVTSSLPVQYQWYQGAAPIADATNAALTLTSFTASQAGNYVAVVTNDYGAVTSSVGVVTLGFAENFDDGVMVGLDGWQGYNTNAAGNNFGFRSSDVSAGTNGAGEAGGTFTRCLNNVYYGDVTLGGTLTLNDPLHAEGELGKTNYASFNGDLRIGYFNTNSANLTTMANFVGFNLADPGGSPATVGNRIQAQIVTAGGSTAGPSAPMDAGTTGPATYRWRMDYDPTGGVNGQGRLSLEFFNSSGTSMGTNFCDLTAAQRTAGANLNAFGFINGQNSANAALKFDVYVDALLYTVANAAPVILTQPASQSVSCGANVTFTSAFDSGSAPAYQWYFNDAPLSGANGSTLTLNAVDGTSAGSYRVVAGNCSGSTTSSVATLEVNSTTAPSISEQPQGLAIALGGSAAFTVVAGSCTPITYQWYHEANPLTDATNSTLTIHNASYTDAGAYQVVVANSFASVTSSVATLTVSNPAPVIVTQPQDLTVTCGSAATFSVVAGGAAPLSYQWYFNGEALADATNATFQRASAAPEHAGAYHVVITNTYGSATSTVAFLTVTPAAPAITAQPQNQLVACGNAATFTVAASSCVPLSGYQWFLGANPIPGATTNPLVVTVRQPAETGPYHVVVSNAGGSTTSAVASASIVTTEHFDDAASVAHNGWAGFGTNTGGGDFGFRNSNNTGGTSAGEMGGTFARVTSVAYYGDVTLGGTFDLDQMLHADGELALANANFDGNIRLGFFQTAGAGQSKLTNVIGVNISEPGGGSSGFRISPVIALANGAALYGAVLDSITTTDTFTFRLDYQPAGGAGYGRLTIELLTAGGTSRGVRTLDLTSAQRSAGASFDAFGAHTGGTGTGNSALRLELYLDALTYSVQAGAPQITNQPVSQLVQLGGNVTFTAAGSSGTPFAYQWFLGTTPIANATNPTLSLNNVTLADAGDYVVVIDNCSGSTTSSVATLTVNRPPVVTNSTAGVEENTALIIDAQKLLLRASDPDDDPLAVVSVASPSTNNGTVTLTVTNTIVYLPPTNYVGMDLFTFTVGDGRGGFTSGEILVSVVSSQGFNQVSFTISNGLPVLTYSGIPGYTYTIERTETLAPPAWVNLATATADAQGRISFIDTNPPPGSAFYRTRYP